MRPPTTKNALVQVIGDTEWRLLHIAPLEVGIYARGRQKLAHLVADVIDPVQREGALQTEIYLTYQKELAAISLQERRLTNQVDKAVAKLEALRKQHQENREKDLGQAKRSLEACAHHNIDPNFAVFGFDFSVTEFQTYQTRRSTYHTLTGGKTLNFDKFLTEFRAETAVQVA